MTYIIMTVITFLIGIEIGSQRPKHKRYAFKKNETLDINNEGELLVSELLKRKFEKENNYLINNVTIANQYNKTTQIDHILINQYGIFIIETKHYSGWIFGNEKNSQWTQIFKNGKKFSFYSPLKQNERHIEKLSEITKTPLYLFRSIIVFTGQGEIRTKISKNVLYLNEIEKHIKKYDLKVLTKEEIYKTIGKIEFTKKEVCKKTDYEHIEQIKKYRFK